MTHAEYRLSFGFDNNFAPLVDSDNNSVIFPYHVVSMCFYPEIRILSLPGVLVCQKPWYYQTYYNDVIMVAMASQITSLTIVYSAIYLSVDQRKHQSSASLAVVRGIHRGPVNSPHKGPVTRKIFPFDDVIMKWSNGSVCGWLDADWVHSLRRDGNTLKMYITTQYYNTMNSWWMYHRKRNMEAEKTMK